MTTDTEIRPEDWHAGELAVLADIDTIADQLGAAAMNRAEVDGDYYLRVPGRLAQADDAELVHALLTAPDADQVVACRDEWVRRSLVRAQARIVTAAAEAAEQAMADAEERYAPDRLEVFVCGSAAWNGARA